MSEIHITRVEYFETMDAFQGSCSCGWASSLVDGDEALKADAEIFEHEAEMGADDASYYAEFVAQVDHEEWLTGASAY